MSKLSDNVKNDVVKKAVYDKLTAKVINTDTSDFDLKTKYQTDKTELEKKIPDVTDFVKKTKLTELFCHKLYFDLVSFEIYWL